MRVQPSLHATLGAHRPLSDSVLSATGYLTCISKEQNSFVIPETQLITEPCTGSNLWAAQLPGQMGSQWCCTSDMLLAGDAKILVENEIARYAQQKKNKKIQPDENSVSLL